MELLTLLSLGCFAILNSALGARRIGSLSTLIQLLFFLLVGLIMAPQVSAPSFIWMMTGFVAFNVIISRFKLLRHPFVSVLPVVLSVALLMILNNGLVFEHFEDKYALMNKFTLTAVVIASLTPVMIHLKELTVTRLFKFDLEGIEQSVSLILIAVSVFLAHFGAGYVGVLLISAILIAAFSYVDLPFSNHVVSPLLIAISGHFIMTMALQIDLLQGDIVLGLFVGAFLVMMTSKLLENANDSILLPGLGIVLIGVVTFAIGYAGSMHPLMGGVDALVAVLISLAIANFFRKDVFPSMIVSSIVIAMILMTPLMEPQPISESSEVQEQVEEQLVEKEPKVVSISDLSGKYSIDEDESSISFVMGKKGETKGAFKKVEGSFSFSEDVSENKLNIELSLEDFTTFNRMRDESLMTDEYFNQENYPGMQFIASGWKEIGKDEYEVEGTFKMLGVSLDETVSVKRIKSDDGIWFMGKGEIDRTKYGMTPSATEGNVVSFSYKIRLEDQK